MCIKGIKRVLERVLSAHSITHPPAEPIIFVPDPPRNPQQAARGSQQFRNTKLLKALKRLKGPSVQGESLTGWTVSVCLLKQSARKLNESRAAALRGSSSHTFLLKIKPTPPSSKRLPFLLSHRIYATYIKGVFTLDRRWPA